MFNCMGNYESDQYYNISIYLLGHKLENCYYHVLKIIGYCSIRNYCEEYPIKSNLIIESLSISVQKMNLISSM